MTGTSRIRLLLALNVCAVLLLIFATALHQAAARLPPDPAVLADQEIVGFCRELQDHLEAGRFDDLEAMARRFASLKDHFKGGLEKLVVFYDELSDPSCGFGRPCDVDYGARIHTLQGWLNRDPGQSTARLVVALTWLRHAWSARQCREPKDVTFDQWQAFFDRVRIANTYVRGLDESAGPEYFIVALSLLRDTGAPRAEIDNLFERGHRLHPKFLSLIGDYAKILDSQMYGRQGELGWLAESVLNDSGGEDGKIAYAVVATSEALQVPYPHLYLETGLSWPRVKEGLALIDKRYGVNNYEWNLYCYMAMIAVDRPAALNAYRHFGPNWDPGVWNNASYFFDQALPWITYEQ